MIPTQVNPVRSNAHEPWQLQMFRYSLKKQQKLDALLKMFNEFEGKQCLLITCGDNNGALNWHFKNQGGTWTWVDAEEGSIDHISLLTGDHVIIMNKSNPVLPLTKETFDVVITIDVHEHLVEPDRINEEIARIVRPGGTVLVTTPNGDKTKLANRIKKLFGMRPEDYGHIVAGYDAPELQKQLISIGLRPYATGSYSRFFTEILELMINFTYVKVLARRSKAKVEKGQIAPQNQRQLKSVEKSYKFYSRLYPIMSAISKLDAFDRADRGYAVIVAAKKE